MIRCWGCFSEGGDPPPLNRPPPVRTPLGSYGFGSNSQESHSTITPPDGDDSSLRPKPLCHNPPCPRVPFFDHPFFLFPSTSLLVNYLQGLPLANFPPDWPSNFSMFRIPYEQPTYLGFIDRGGVRNALAPVPREKGTPSRSLFFSGLPPVELPFFFPALICNKVGRPPVWFGVFPLPPGGPSNVSMWKISTVVDLNTVVLTSPYPTRSNP